jgi:UDP-4-amino-4,6-dideoxy-N-acetyl-beta-L-altrosamine N-acetyltransferase
MLIGENVVLRTAEREDLDTLWMWANDRQITKWLLIEAPVSRVAEERWLEHMLTSATDRFFVICTRDMTPIGTIVLSQINMKHRKARTGISIFEHDYLGRGLGTEAMQLLINFAFWELGLHRVELDVFEENVRAIRSYEKVGFKVEGMSRDCYFKDGRFINALIMSVLDTEWSRPE